MKILSLFDGITCGRVALERAYIPIEAYFASEIDKRAIMITQKNYPDTIQIGDVLKLNFADFVDKIDMLIGGSPCQDLSIAKRNREGLKGRPSDPQIRQAVSDFFGTPDSYCPDPNSKRKRLFRADVFDAMALIMATEE